MEKTDIEIDISLEPFFKSADLKNLMKWNKEIGCEKVRKITQKPFVSLGLRWKNQRLALSEARFYSKDIEN